MPPQGSFAQQGRAATMMGRRPQSSDGNALFHAALRKRNEDMSTRDSRVVHKSEEEENQFLPPLPQHRHIGRKRPSDEAALNCDFKYLLIRHGSYAKARSALRAARQQQYTDKMKRLAKAESERQKVIEVQQVIKLSNTTGHPTLTNPISKQIATRKKKNKPPPPPSHVPESHGNSGIANRPLPRRPRRCCSN